MLCFRGISLNYGSFIFKTRQRWNYNICCTGIWFSARVDTREKQLRTWREEGGAVGWYNGQMWVRPDRWPRHSRWPIRAFILKIWEEVEDSGPGVRHADKLPLNSAARCPPSLLPHLRLIPSLSSSFVCLLSLTPLSFWSQSISPDRTEWYELNKPQELIFETSLALPSSGLLAIFPYSLFLLEQFDRDG